jgi:predicted TIM-barrel fold metal-dependent hydrolase
VPPTPAEEDFPGIISVDDHVVEPRQLWQQELPARWREKGPRTVREKVRLQYVGGVYSFERDVDDGRWCDVWLFDDLVYPTGLLHAPVGYAPEDIHNLPATYEDFRPGAYEQGARLQDMSVNHVEAAMCFPNVFPRFCGQGFAERVDKELSLASLRIYNDWMIDEWCGGGGRGRLIPLTLVPLWDAKLAADEVWRCATKGSHAIAFTENPHRLGLPTMYSGHWEPLWQACEDTDTVIAIHIGSSSQMPSTSPDAPPGVSAVLTAQNAQGSLCDWVFSGALCRHPALRILFAEAQVGWMPYVLERMDTVWHESPGWNGVELTEPPSDIVRGSVFGCLFDDPTGLANRHAIGMDALLFETDYPHSDGTWPHSRAVAHRICAAAGLDAAEVHGLLRGNAVTCLGLERFGIAG